MYIFPRRRKPSYAEVIRNITLKKEMDRASKSMFNTSVCHVAVALDQLTATAHKILRKFLLYYCFKRAHLPHFSPFDYPALETVSLEFLTGC